jgi:hypothetical protein
MPEFISLNPSPSPQLASTVAERLGVLRATLVSAIHTGKAAPARKIDGVWHIEPGAVWERWPVGTNGTSNP